MTSFADCAIHVSLVQVLNDVKVSYINKRWIVSEKRENVPHFSVDFDTYDIVAVKTYCSNWLTDGDLSKQ